MLQTGQFQYPSTDEQRNICTMQIHSAIHRTEPTNSHNNIDESQKHYAKWKTWDKRNYSIRVHLYEILEQAKLIWNDRNQIRGAKELRRGNRIDYRKEWRNFWGQWKYSKCKTILLKKWISFYVNYTSINLTLKNIN